MKSGRSKSLGIAGGQFPMLAGLAPQFVAWDLEIEVSLEFEIWNLEFGILP
jgi:hypothetical protein